MVAREDVGGWPSNLGMLAPTKPQFLRQPTSDADGGYATAQQDLREDKIIGRTELVYMNHHASNCRYLFFNAITNACKYSSTDRQTKKLPDIGVCRGK